MALRKGSVFRSASVKLAAVYGLLFAFSAFALVFDGSDVRRQQAVQGKCVALRLRKCGPFVEARTH